jgi:hypothetical protein
MQLGELCRWHSLATAVRPGLVVVLTPECDGRSGLLQRLEPLLVQALVTEFAVKALDVAVLHGPAGLDQDVANAMSLRPAHKGPAGEFRAVVCAYGQRVAPEDSGLVEQPRHVLARYSPVHREGHALVAEVISHRQAFDAPPGTQAVADKVHAPHLIDRRGQLQRDSLADGAFDLLSLAHRQIGGAVKAVDALVVHAREVWAQHVVDTPVAEASTRMCDLNDLAAELLRHGICLGWMAIAVTGEPHKSACTPFAHITLLNHDGDGRTLDLWG